MWSLKTQEEGSKIGSMKEKCAAENKEEGFTISK